ncbi:Crp/Fnr family transcriptional regulator [uncultured Thiodictyon sp.]|uniref:Crp/Fnr family transcriptional regulator n=1 Tax=uncultured Thiodictyon sp. TaxID=1846217 RepID=UPI0025D361DE|nr:cyclic nucleotide-binding domain-containing protein [uncultured Thiodictyon sp.]
MNQVDKLEALRASHLAAELDDTEAQALAGQMGVTALSDGELLVSEGDDSRTLFLVAAGAVNVSQIVGGHEEVIYQMRAGEFAGTRAFVDGSPRKAGLRAVGECTAFTLEPADFESLGKLHPMLLYRVMRALFRITHTNLTRANQESTQLRNYMLRTGGPY